MPSHHHRYGEGYATPVSVAWTTRMMLLAVIVPASLFPETGCPALAVGRSCRRRDPCRWALSGSHRQTGTEPSAAAKASRRSLCDDRMTSVASEYAIGTITAAVFDAIL